MEKWEIELRAKLEEELEEGTYEIGGPHAMALTGKKGKIEFEVALQKYVRIKKVPVEQLIVTSITCKYCEKKTFKTDSTGTPICERRALSGSCDGFKPRTVLKLIGRNEPCPCGSGKKYKKCCALGGLIEPDIMDKEEKEKEPVKHEEVPVVKMEPGIANGGSVGEGPNAKSTERQLTFGEKAVGLTFNPGNNPAVDQCKKDYANIIDNLHALRMNANTTVEGKRMASIAITEAQTSQMWAVKAITWRD
jgi:hypothetical protein